MRSKVLLFLLIGASTMWAQRVTGRMNASIRGGGGEGKCTIEVVVDDTADVEISGSNAVIRTLRGGPASFRRFECNQPMPNRPASFRFEGVDGRGSQTLVSSPQNGGPAVVRIQDPRSGTEGYTFDIFWSGGDYGRGGYGNNGGYGNDGYGRDRDRDYGRDRDDGRWGNNNNGWNNDFSFNGHGAGTLRNQGKRIQRISSANVFIGRNGVVNVSFNGESGRVDFTGNVDSRDNRRVIANMNGAGRSGQMVIELNRDRVSRITMPSAYLSWND